jgi:eukaryotic-like serine/threonine-protein kinase
MNDLDNGPCDFPRALARGACSESWLVRPLLPWGPAVADTRRLVSQRVVEIIATRVGADLPDVADKLLSMRSQHRYLLIESVARTRRCSVFAAVDQLLAREVALKVHHDSDDETTWRLQAEVQAMSRFEHANVVRIYDVDEHDGWRYSVMELCDADLRAWSRDKGWIEVLDRLLELGRGLSCVHAAGLVHADVKPANVLIKDRIAKLGDFGFATTPGWSAHVSGTPGYIAPEVADGRQGFEGDVFAFACCAWTCLCGYPPFGEPPADADTSAATMVLVERAREGEFSERGRDLSGIPSGVKVALRWALRPEPAKRSTLDEFLAQLTALRTGKVFGGWVRWRRLGGRGGR